MANEATSSEFVAWRNKTAGPYNPSTILYGDLLYVLYDQGFFACYDGKTGDEVYKKQRIPDGKSFTASPWAYGQKVFCLNEDGQTFVMQTGKDFEVLGTNTLADDDMCMATPAIAGDRLLASALQAACTASAKTPNRPANVARSESRIKMPPSKPWPGPCWYWQAQGTGKTRVVTYRIAELIKHGTRPSRILAVTFTNKAAKEIQRPLGAMLGKQLKEKPEISTFHSLCVRILRRHAPPLGLCGKEICRLRSGQIRKASPARACANRNVADDLLRPSDLINTISRWKMPQSVRPDEAASLANNDKDHLASMAYRRYQRATQTGRRRRFR